MPRVVTLCTSKNDQIVEDCWFSSNVCHLPNCIGSAVRSSSGAVIPLGLHWCSLLSATAAFPLEALDNEGACAGCGFAGTSCCSVGSVLGAECVFGFGCSGGTCVVRASLATSATVVVAFECHCCTRAPQRPPICHTSSTQHYIVFVEFVCSHPCGRAVQRR